MLNVLLSHWAIYAYVIYVLVILILCWVSRDRSVHAYRRVWRLPADARLLAARWRPRIRPLR